MLQWNTTCWSSCAHRKRGRIRRLQRKALRTAIGPSGQSTTAVKMHTRPQSQCAAVFTLAGCVVKRNLPQSQLTFDLLISSTASKKSISSYFLTIGSSSMRHSGKQHSWSASHAVGVTVGVSDLWMMSQWAHFQNCVFSGKQGKLKKNRIFFFLIWAINRQVWNILLLEDLGELKTARCESVSALHPCPTRDPWQILITLQYKWPSRFIVFLTVTNWLYLQHLKTSVSSFAWFILYWH